MPQFGSLVGLVNGQIEEAGSLGSSFPFRLIVCERYQSDRGPFDIAYGWSGCVGEVSSRTGVMDSGAIKQAHHFQYGVIFKIECVIVRHGDRINPSVLQYCNVLCVRTEMEHFMNLRPWPAFIGYHAFQVASTPVAGMK
jgi:hypothetical protein